MFGFEPKPVQVHQVQIKFVQPAPHEPCRCAVCKHKTEAVIFAFASSRNLAKTCIKSGLHPGQPNGRSITEKLLDRFLAESKVLKWN